MMPEIVPARAVVARAEGAKKNMPTDRTATGDVEGSLSIRENGASAQGAQILGSGEIAKLHLRSASNKVELDLDSIPLVLASADSVEIASLEKKIFSSTNARSGAQSFAGPFLEFWPFPLGIGRGLQPVLQGSVRRSGYRASLTGHAEGARA